MPTKANTGSYRRRSTAALRPIPAITDGEAVIPPLPPERAWTPEARRWWEVVHRSAISMEWTPDDLLVVERGLSLVDDLAAIETDPELTLERKTRLKINLSAEMRLMESSLGLSPAGRSRLRVEVVKAEDAERRRGRSRPSAEVTDDELARRRADLRAQIESRG